MTSRLLRNYQLSLDYAHGATLEQLAFKYDVSPGRIHQIYVETMAKCALIRFDKPTQAIKLLEHLRYWEAKNNAKRDTPEYHYMFERGELDYSSFYSQ